jgi:hypothetical protein
MTSKQAKDILLRMAAAYPGLVNGTDEVPGAELVEWVSNEFHALSGDAELDERAKYGSPFTDDAMAIAQMERVYIQFARAHIQRDEEVEIDDDPMVSMSDGGAYVAAWIWVDDRDLKRGWGKKS